MRHRSLATTFAGFVLLGIAIAGDICILKSEVALAQGVSVEELTHEVLDLSSHPRLLLDTKIETPARNNSVLTLPEKKAGDTIQFQLFAPDLAGREFLAMEVQLAMRGKTFSRFLNVISYTGPFSVKLRVQGSTVVVGTLPAMEVAPSGYLGQVTLTVSRELTSSDAMEVASARVGSTDGDENLDVSVAQLSFTQAAVCVGDFDGDGSVSLADFLAFAGAFGAQSGDANFNALMDLDGSGAVDLSDFLAFAGVFGTTCPIPTSPTVTIPDANLRAVISDSLGKARGAPITRSEMATLRRIDAGNRGIRSLTGLEHATNLRVLVLGFKQVNGEWVNSNDISNLSPLTNLTNLRILDLSGNNISDISPLSNLTNLILLGLIENSVTDISALSGLTNLEFLSLFGNSISDISALSGLTNLESLYLSANSISDISPLVANMGLGSGDEVYLATNPLSSTSINTHIPALQRRGVTVEFDSSGGSGGGGSPDLVVDAASVSDASLTTGESFTLRATVRGRVCRYDAALLPVFEYDDFRQRHGSGHGRSGCAECVRDERRINQPGRAIRRGDVLLRRVRGRRGR